MRSFSLRTTLVAAMVGLTLATAALIGTVSYRSALLELREDAVRAVGAVADSHKLAFVRMLNRQVERAERTLAGPLARCGADRQCLARVVEDHERTERAAGIRLLEAGGELVASGEIPDQPVAASRPGQIAAFVRRSGGDATFTIRVVRAARELQVTFPVDPIAAIMRDRSGLGASGEVFLVDPAGYFLTPSRYPSAAGHSQPIAAAPIVRCLAGENAEAIATNYRGADVVHGFRHVREIGGGCIDAHIDRAEVFAPAAALGRRLAAITVVFMLGGVAVALVIAHVIAAPLGRLREAAGALEEGRYDAPLPSGGPTEIAGLAGAVRSMAASLKVSHDSLDQARAEAERQRDFFRAVYESDIVGICCWSWDGWLTQPNRALLRMLGYPEEDFAQGALRSRDITPGEYDEADARALEELRHFGVCAPVSKEYIRKDGTRLPVIVGASIQQGAERGTFFVLDVTEQRYAVAQLQRSEQRYRSLVAATASIVWTTDADGTFVTPQPSWEAYTGQPWEQHRGWSWTHAIHPDDVEEVKARWQGALETRSPYEAYGRIWHAPSGQYRHFVARAVPVTAPDGAVREWIGTVTDVHERRVGEARALFLSRASAALASSLDYEQTLATVSKLAVPEMADWCAVDLIDGEEVRRLAIEHSAPDRQAAARRLMQRRPSRLASDEGLGRALREARPVLYEQFDEQMTARAGADPEQAAIARELGLRSAIIVPLIVRGQAIGGITLVTSDSKRAYTKADLPFAEELARRAVVAIDNARLYRETLGANRLKDEFLATLSHELRTPLNAILGWANMLRRPGLSPEHLARGIETIERNAGLQAQLIADLLDVSRITSGAVRLEPEDVDLRPLMEQAADTVRPMAEAGGVRLLVRVGEEPAVVYGDPSRLQQIVWNLLANAVKFTAGGQVELTLTAHNGQAEITVSDNGRGIDPAFLPYIFDPFRQADSSTTRTHGGLGLGLAIVRHLAELHGGSVTAVSEGVSRGSLFRVSLPLKKPVPLPH
ncbi:MAG: ATP-binding protein [Vicinamibacterales bacterium]